MVSFQAPTEAADLVSSRFAVRFDDGDQKTVRGADIIFRQVSYLRAGLLVVLSMLL